MTRRYLYPRQRQVEVISALYVGGFGFYIWAQDIIGNYAPVSQLRLDHEGQMAFAYLLVASSFFWAVGIRVNGSWWGSPFLRVGAMCINFTAAVFASIQGNWSSATYTYAWVSIFAAIGLMNALRDAKHAWQGERMWTN